MVVMIYGDEDEDDGDNNCYFQTRESAFRNVKSIAECLADELINAASSYFVLVQLCITFLLFVRHFNDYLVHYRGKFKLLRNQEER